MRLVRWLRRRLRPGPRPHGVVPAQPRFSLVAPHERPMAGSLHEIVPTLAHATGEFVCWLQPGEHAREEVFARLEAMLREQPETDVLFTDELRANGPFHKPGWSPALLLAQPYATCLAAVRMDLVRAVGEPRQDAGTAAIYDFLLRATAAARTVRHVPALGARTRSVWSPDADSVRAAQAAATAMGLTATVTADGVTAVHRISVRPRQRQPVTVVVPTRDRLDLLRVCIDSVLATTAADQATVLIVDNGSVEPATLAQLLAWSATGRVRVLRDDSPFDYSALMNRAVQATTTPLVLLLNNDTKVLSADWLDQLAGWLDLPDVAAVGGKLYYQDDTVQHAGVVLGIGGVASHGHKGFPRAHGGYHGLLHSVRDVSAVTGACLLTRRDDYLGIGGLDPDLRVAYNDVDYCLRLRQRGRRVLWTPWAEAYHFEGKSRGDDRRGQSRFDREIAFMQRRWGALLADDPFYNPNLALDATDYRLRRR